MLFNQLFNTNNHEKEEATTSTIPSVCLYFNKQWIMKMTAACIKIEEVVDGKHWIYFAWPNENDSFKVWLIVDPLKGHHGLQNWKTIWWF